MTDRVLEPKDAAIWSRHPAEVAGFFVYVHYVGPWDAQADGTFECVCEGDSVRA